MVKMFGLLVLQIIPSFIAIYQKVNMEFGSAGIIIQFKNVILHILKKKE